jgi:hypothetical protein
VENVETSDSAPHNINLQKGHLKSANAQNVFQSVPQQSSKHFQQTSCVGMFDHQQ